MAQTKVGVKRPAVLARLGMSYLLGSPYVAGDDDENWKGYEHG